MSLHRDHGEHAANEAASHDGVTCDACHETFHERDIKHADDLRLCERCLGELEEMRRPGSAMEPVAAIFRKVYGRP